MVCCPLPFALCPCCLCIGISGISDNPGSSQPKTKQNENEERRIHLFTTNHKLQPQLLSYKQVQLASYKSQLYLYRGNPLSHHCFLHPLFHPGQQTITSTMCESPTPKNGIQTHTWFYEDQAGQAALTDDGAENIARHKYKPGHYTHLDTLLNPFWTFITDLLPMSMAPNVVTTLGGLHCAMSYAVLWYYSPNMDEPVPDWVIAFSGFCTLAYYTFDCMDGKQARRTGNSTPLGQLFDHGFDCLCLLAHVSGTAGYLMMGGSYWYLAMQTSLQFSFFMAQWEGKSSVSSSFYHVIISYTSIAIFKILKLHLSIKPFFGKCTVNFYF